MPRPLTALVLCSLALMVPSPRTRAQAPPSSNGALKATLLGRGDEMMAAWKRHDSAGITATFAPDFVYVGSDALGSDVDATLKVLMACTVSSYRIAASSLKQLSPTTAVLLTRQEQQITCFGHPLPAVMNMTDTYVERDGKWLILIHTEAAASAH